MIKNTNTARAELTTLNDSDLDLVVGGWGHCGYGRRNYGCGYGYGYGRGYDCKPNYGGDDNGYGYDREPRRRDVEQTANVVVTVNQIA
jgi:hypothetical protein